MVVLFASRKPVMRFLAGMIGILLLFSGCQKQEAAPETSSGENPFTSQGGGEEPQYAYGFGISEPAYEVDMVYSGEPVQGTYYIDCLGSDMTAGILMFVNGIPQPYQAKDQPERYMHVHQVPSGELVSVPFSFTPVCGKAGQALSVRFVSILNPDIRPTSSNYIFGNNGMGLVISPRTIHMEKDAPVQPEELATCSPQREMTQDEVEEVIYVDRHGLQINKMESMHLFASNCTDANLPYIPVDNGIASFDVTLYGGPECQYVLVPYINHTPVFSQDFPCMVEVGQGTKIFDDTFSIDLTQLEKQGFTLEDFNTFYLVAIPIQEGAGMDIQLSYCKILER